MLGLNDFVADPTRVLLGAIAAPVLAALFTEIPTFHFRDYWTVALLGLLSVVTLYLPLVLWRLRRTRHPFWACVILGGLSAPGLLGYALGIMGSFITGQPAVIFLTMVLVFPLGAIGGAIFWLCAVWRSEGFEQA